MTVLHDLTPRISPRLAVWPGDVPWSRQVALDMQAGAHLTLSATTSTVHLGAHADAPNHYLRHGAGIADRPLAPYLGACEVFRVHVPRGSRVGVRHLPSEPTTPRLLLDTGTFPDPEQFPTDFAALDPDLVHWAADRGVVLLGIDTPSVDLFASKALEAHTAVAARDLSLLEGLLLAGVPEGRYTLVALPLPLDGADASPVRAVLLPRLSELP